MNNYVCGKCLFAEECSSSDLLFCPIKNELRKVNDYPCAKWKNKREKLEEEEEDE
jgi:hypothetical protein